MEFIELYTEFFSSIPEDEMDKSRFVPASGDRDADYILIGEAPGANEVEEGEPFVGRAGERLDEILEDIGVERNSLYITNLVKIRPPENRDPRRDEIDAWRPLLEREIEDVDPKVVIPMGNFASREILDTNRGITEIHGRIFSRDGRKVMPAFHPAATLYDRSKAPELKKDLRKAFGKSGAVQKKLGEEPER